MPPFQPRDDDRFQQPPYQAAEYQHKQLSVCLSATSSASYFACRPSLDLTTPAELDSTDVVATIDPARIRSHNYQPDDGVTQRTKISGQRCLLPYTTPRLVISKCPEQPPAVQPPNLAPEPPRRRTIGLRPGRSPCRCELFPVFPLTPLCLLPGWARHYPTSRQR